MRVRKGGLVWADRVEREKERKRDREREGERQRELVPGGVFRHRSGSNGE